jgi:hypothetical protein
MPTTIVRAGLEKACKEFTRRVEPLGFRRTLKMFWVRRHPFTLDFIHFHRHGSSYGAPRSASVDIRVHFGIRVLNDDFVAANLNGPYSDPGMLRTGNYHLRFNAESGSTYERCVDDLVRLVIDQGEHWFSRFHSVEALLHSPDSPLKPQQREFLLAAQQDRASADRLRASLKIFGIKES